MFRAIIRTNRIKYELELLKLLLEPQKASILIKEKRQYMGIRECARDIGVSAATLSRLERGYNYDVKTMKLIFEWLTQK